MAPRSAGSIRVGFAALATMVSAATNKILAQIGDIRGETESDNAEWWQHVGFASRPSKAVPSKEGAQVVLVRGGDRDAVIASQDLRGLELYGGLEDGETCVYAAGADGSSQARTLYKADGSIHHYTRKGNTPDGAGMTLQIDAMAGAIRMLNDQGFALIIDADGIKLTAGKAGLTLNADGSWALIGTGPAKIDGAVVAVGGDPSTNAVTDGVLCGPTGISGVTHTKLVVSKA